MKQLGRKKVGGFTLIELLLVIGIIGILSSIGLVSFIASINRGKDSQRKAALSTLSKALDTYKADIGSYPAQGPNNEIMGCMNPSDHNTFVACPTDGQFHYWKNDQEVSLIGIYPEEPVAGKIYRYEFISGSDTVNESFALYAALDNFDPIAKSGDKDVKKLADGTVDPAGWTVMCGSAVCNYKITDSGLVTK